MATIQASIDHFIGYTATDVLTRSDAWDWSIQLEGGIIISNKDEERTEAPTDVTGKTLAFVALGELDTRLQFAHVTLQPDGTSVIAEEVWVNLSPLKYTLGGMEGQEEEYYPQAPPELEDVLPPDPSPDRVADGPTGPEEEAAQAAEKPAKAKRAKK